MPSTFALPFYLSRSDDVYGATEIVSTTEQIHGLLRLDGERLVVQWRIARETERVGWEIRTDHEIEPVREVVLPLETLGSAAVHRRGWRRLFGTRLVLTAADLRAFEGIAGAAGLRLAHPATLTLGIPRADRLAAEEFAAELNLAVAQHALETTKPPSALPPAAEPDPHGGTIAGPAAPGAADAGAEPAP